MAWISKGADEPLQDPSRREASIQLHVSNSSIPELCGQIEWRQGGRQGTVEMRRLLQLIHGPDAPNETAQKWKEAGRWMPSSRMRWRHQIDAEQARPA